VEWDCRYSGKENCMTNKFIKEAYAKNERNERREN
jgi:hypothetical protein